MIFTKKSSRTYLDIMKYIDLVVDSINKANKKENILFYGENLNFGSCLGGMGRGLKASKKSLILNVQNSELTRRPRS